MGIHICVCIWLSFSFHWLCSADKAVGFFGLMFKRQQNESPCSKSVTVTETVLSV